VRLAAEIHLVGSGRNGLGLTDAFDCNVYLLDGGSEWALIDTGSAVRLQPLLDEIERTGVALDRIGHILLTHKHADHSAGAAELHRLTGARVYATAGTAAAVGDADAFNAGLDRARRAGIYPADFVYHAVEVTDVVADGDAIRIGGLELSVIDTPGHCADHCSFVFESSLGKAVLTGDALFPGGTILLQPIADCSIPETVATIEKLAGLEADALLAGHGAPVLSNAERHVELALDRIRNGKIPFQLFW
jgi:glyoxylase-like metal-dependent hydrolase (beta-lactamase superfamily II)